ncbi:MAG: carboxylating nicotinate-nucleotide diphosphorylase [Alphaproteobacteria bacterium]|nr:carboxylating nicotinate-nucleotide diphosphorylase [Alphaproteobacteria bacterium]
MPLSPLPDLILRPLVANALCEDLGRAGDITTDAIIPPDMQSRAKLNARQTGILAGLDLARLAFQLFDPTVIFTPLKQDGEAIRTGDSLAQVEGAARSLLSAERVALNFLCHLSGIASETHKLVEAVKPHKARICCTRKTTPGLRAIEKYAVKAGGGSNHRFGLDDAVLIKDNHIVVAGSIKNAVERAQSAVGHLVKVEIEVDTLAQLDEALALLSAMPIDAVLLDNMQPAQLKLAVEKVAGRLTVEASGGITLESVAAIAATGVDVISVGGITHSAPILDIGLDIVGDQ